MITSPIGDEISEDFDFPNGMNVHVDYGILFHTDHEYHPCFKRYSGSLRRTQLLDQESNIVTEVIENNPDEMDYEREQNILAKGLKIGDEFERSINFPNGYIVKIEYWVSPTKRDENFGRYSAKYQKKILLDENNNIISEILDSNPYYINPEVEVININYEDIDFD